MTGLSEGESLKIIFLVGAIAHAVLAAVMLIATIFTAYYYKRLGSGLYFLFVFLLLSLLYIVFWVDWCTGFMLRADSVEVAWIRPFVTVTLLWGLTSLLVKYANLSPSPRKLVKTCIAVTCLALILSDVTSFDSYYLPCGFAAGFFVGAVVIALRHARPIGDDATTIDWLGITRFGLAAICYIAFGAAVLLWQFTSYMMYGLWEVYPHRLTTEAIFLPIVGCGCVFALIAHFAQPTRESALKKAN